MALSSNYRWVVVGVLSIRNRKGSPHYAPAFTLGDLVTAIEGRLQAGDGYRAYSRNQARVMWCSDVEQDNDYVRFIIQAGDKNVAGVSFLNFDTMASRDINKEENEGVHYGSHVLIKRVTDAQGRYLILIEKVPGIHLSSVKDHFTWLCNHHSYEKESVDENGNAKRFRAVFEINGHQSRTIREALRTGSLQDIEFVSHEETHPDGLDEDSVIQDIIHEARWEIKRRVTEDEARSLFGKIRGFVEGLRGSHDHTKTFIRIKADNGQIKRSEIEHDGDEILEQAFVQNEMVSDFERPLTQRYNGIRQDMIEKMVALADNFGG